MLPTVANSPAVAGCREHEVVRKKALLAGNENKKALRRMAWFLSAGSRLSEIDNITPGQRVNAHETGRPSSGGICVKLSLRFSANRNKSRTH